MEKRSMNFNQKDSAGNIFQEFKEAGKLDNKPVGNENTITVGCGAYMTIICCK